MDFRLLGPLSVELDQVELPLGGQRERNLLALLLLQRNRVVPVDRLVDAVWAEAPPATARHQLHVCVSALRRRLSGGAAAGVIETRPPGYLARVGAGQVDVDVFTARVAHARREAAAGRHAAAERELRAALDLWRGPVLADVDSPAVRGLAEHLGELRVVAAEERLESLLVLGAHGQVSGDVADLIAHHPLRERLRRLQIVALYRSGRVPEALAAFRTARAAFVSELGIEPGEELQALHRAVLARDDGELNAADRRPDPPPPAVMAMSVTGPATGLIEAAVPRQLPPAVADFTGRSDLVDVLCRRLSDVDGPARLLVLGGPAGSGKTSLAVRVAQLTRDAFPDGQLFVDVRGGTGRPAAHRQPVAVVAERLLRGLGVAGAAVPGATEDRVALFRSLVADRRILLVLDDAGGEADIQALLPGTPSCATLVTTRRRLTGLGGARHTEVGMLDPVAATRLLVTCVGRRVDLTEPTPTAALVALCDGLPLALRIAAARLTARPHWRVADLLARLSDERHRLDELVHEDMRVRPGIRLAYDGLSAPGRRLFRRLGLVDVRDFAAWTAAPLLDCDPATAAEVLEELVDVRLVDAAADGERGTRYRMRGLPHVFSRERLEAEETAADREGAVLRWLGCAQRAADRSRCRGADQTTAGAPRSRWPLATAPRAAINRAVAGLGGVGS